MNMKFTNINRNYERILIKTIFGQLTVVNNIFKSPHELLKNQPNVPYYRCNKLRFFDHTFTKYR